ncbi:MAG: universal stress protein [Ignavibacteriales bacterium]|nr:universal stress protein [Ignavibacteriales bacterium]
MMNFQRILCPLDVHDPDIAAVQTAVDLCNSRSGILYILYVIEDIAGSGIGEQFSFYQKPSPTEYKAIRKTIVGILSHHVPESIKTIPVIHRGHVAHCIVDEARQKAVDLVVLSRRKRSVAEELLFHSAADAVIRNAPCPVFVIRRSSHESIVQQSAALEYQWMEE